MTAETVAFADVNRVKQAGKGYYLHVMIAGTGIWTRINKDTYVKVKELLKNRGKDSKEAKSATA